MARPKSPDKPPKRTEKGTIRYKYSARFQLTRLKTELTKIRESSVRLSTVIFLIFETLLAKQFTEVIVESRKSGHFFLAHEIA